jgi:hypothetical protein
MRQLKGPAVLTAALLVPARADGSKHRWFLSDKVKPESLREAVIDQKQSTLRFSATKARRRRLASIGLKRRSQNYTSSIDVGHPTANIFLIGQMTIQWLTIPQRPTLSWCQFQKI